MGANFSCVRRRRRNKENKKKKKKKRKKKKKKEKKGEAGGVVRRTAFIRVWNKKFTVLKFPGLYSRVFLAMVGWG
jgi:hypothetical protein